jgi:AcrR family transcriptional regulator
MGKQAENKVRNRQAIMEAAVGVFAEKGKDNATISDVVQACGLARGTFYNYFPSLETLWDALLEAFFHTIAENVHRARSQAPDLEAFVREGYQTYFRILAANPIYIQLIVRNPHAVRQSFMQAPTSLSVYRQLEEDMHRSGFFKAYSDQEIRIQCVAMIGAVFELLSHIEAPDQHVDPDIMAGTLTRLFVHGLKG